MRYLKNDIWQIDSGRRSGRLFLLSTPRTFRWLRFILKLKQQKCYSTRPVLGIQRRPSGIAYIQYVNHIALARDIYREAQWGEEKK